VEIVVPPESVHPVDPDSKLPLTISSVAFAGTKLRESAASTKTARVEKLRGIFFVFILWFLTPLRASK
jgi:hypothetical protein